MKLYKLTDESGMTRGKTKWGEGVTHTLPEVENPTMCSGEVLHAYKSLNLALLLNPIHTEITDVLIWEAEGEVCKEDWGKCATFSLTTTKMIPSPDWYLDDGKRKKVSVQFAILCAEEVLPLYERWNGADDRPRKAIEAAKEYLGNNDADAYAADASYDAARDAHYARASFYAAARASFYAAAHAARAAAHAAYAAHAAHSSEDDYDTYAHAAYAADASYDASHGAIDLTKLADMAVNIVEKRVKD